MAKKQLSFKTKGMNRDMSVSAFNPEFSFENINLRLSTNEHNTMMSWVNEKGPASISVTIDLKPWLTSNNATESIIRGTTIGTAVLNKKLILFTTNCTDGGWKNDSIYVLEYSGELTMTGKLLYNGNLNFSTDNPLETLVSFEAEHIQKVYWTDGRNQPRIINIKAKDSKIEMWNTHDDNDDSVDTFFDFIPCFKTTETISIKKKSSGGIFGAGVIQYCFTYVNKYGQQSNIFYTSSLHYLTHDNRAASPEENTNNSFEITIKDFDTRFDYIRLYSVHRTSLDDVPTVRLLDSLLIADWEIEYDSNEVEHRVLRYTDNGTTGSTFDPTELLYVGGKEITALTMAEKDHTLFLGNITQPNTILIDKIQEYFDENRESTEIRFVNDSYNNFIYNDDPEGAVYSYNTQLVKQDVSDDNQPERTSEVVTTFKGGETYRFGIQLQRKTGEWTEPIFIDDKENEQYPRSYLYDNRLIMRLCSAAATINFDDLAEYVYNAADIDKFYDSYQKVRPVIVHPNINDRTVLCQGVLNPTVFNVVDRIDNSPYAQASWFFRPYMQNALAEDSEGYSYVSKEAYHTQSTAPDSDFDEKTTNVYVLIDKCSKEEINKILANGRLIINSFNIEQQGTTYIRRNNRPIIQAIVCGTIPLGNDLYAFITTRPWRFVSEMAYYKVTPGAFTMSQETAAQTINGNHDDNYNGYRSTKQIRINNDYEYKIYSRINSGANSFMYYTKKEVNSDTYNFRFLSAETPDTNDNYHNDTYWEIQFTSHNVVIDGGNLVNTTPLIFDHYTSLKANSDISAEFKNGARAVEIQGSTNLYESPFDERKDDITSNTQFFVDQSIVTLNSPDLEFDTQVQSFDMENLKLRIVGAIPITSNVSSHEIIATDMLGIEETEGNATTVKFGTGELDYNVVLKNIALDAGNRLVSDYLWNDVIVDGSNREEKADVSTGKFHNFLIYPWQRTGSLTNDNREKTKAKSWLTTKKEANLLYSYCTEYFHMKHDNNGWGPVADSFVDFTNISTQVHLKENNFVKNYKLPKQKSTTSDINYYPNIDKVLYNKEKYDIITSTNVPQNYQISGPVSMKYLSNTHAVIALNAVDVIVQGQPPRYGVIPILPYAKEDMTDQSPTYHREIGKYTNPESTDYKTFWGDEGLEFIQEGVDFVNMFKNGSNFNPHNFLWLGELYKDVINRFGGTSKSAIRSNEWRVGGKEYNISQGSNNLEIRWTEGDTYYQRYDCLKTYAMTPEDTNQIVEILSFMCETHVNIDGRYDRNRGQMKNTDMNPTIFNLLNGVYSQRNNFFINRRADTEDWSEANKLAYPNQIYYTKTKQSGADVDMFTNINLGSTLELDGDKGQITALRRFNDSLIAFQDTGISQIMYNENVQISSTAGVPIEIANSGKVQGSRYISNTIGCANKWSIVTTPSGIYFMDNHDKSMWLFDGQLKNISTAMGFNTWAKDNIISRTWNPVTFGCTSNGDKGSFVSYYDKLNQDVMFINKNTALSFSEKFSTFTSFYSYGNTPYFCNFVDSGVWAKPFSLNTVEEGETPSYIDTTKLYRHQAGNYCDFFGTTQPYSMTLVGNPEPQLDKVFTNLEFRACVDGEGILDANSKYIPHLPFDFLEAWNEYQHGYTQLSNKQGHDSMVHHTPDNDSALIRKFRIWRNDIPRDNVPNTSQQEAGNGYTLDSELGITRFNPRKLNRIRNPWVYIKLQKNSSDNTALPRAEIHDVAMTYYT